MTMPDSPEPKPYECPWCSAPLPMVLASPRDVGAQSVHCAKCGTRFLAVVWKTVPDRLKDNLRMGRAWED